MNKNPSSILKLSRRSINETPRSSARLILNGNRSDENFENNLLSDDNVRAPYAGPIFDAARYLKRVTVTFRGLLKDKLW